MPGLNDVFNVSSTGLQAYQSQISVYGNNIANVNTTGYSRRTVGLETSIINNTLGTGVRTGDITRVYNTMGRYALLQEQSSYSYHSELADRLSALEMVAGSSNSGIDDALGEFQNALQDAISSPTDLTTRTTLLQRASTLATEINRVDSKITSALNETESILGNPSSVAEEVNDLTEQLQQLNHNIYKASSAGRSIPDLLDKRDLLVRELSEKINITVSPDYQISFAGQELVSFNGVNRNELVVDSSNVFTVGGVDVSASVTGGKLAAVLAARQAAEVLQTQVNALASTLITQINAVFDAGYNLQGERPVDLGYTFFTGTSAADITVDSTLYDPVSPLDAHAELLALASTANAGDNSVGQLMFSALQIPQASLGNNSISTYWMGCEATLGGYVREEEQLSASSQAVLDMLDGEMLSTSGVNLDEEFINLMGAQKAYQACARVLSTANDLLSELMNLTR
ncbi:MAG: flagellar hook-associated protein FlgK [Pontiellaceae bacterium]|nr:flagellar hook-associated protein FlgK [Pontiellaceae bacterium]